MNSRPIDLNLKLSIEQEFKMRLMQESAHKMSREQAVSLLIDASRLLMIKDNVIKSLMKQTL